MSTATATVPVMAVQTLDIKPEYTRNDISIIAEMTTIPIGSEEFSWGKYEPYSPPRIDHEAGKIFIPHGKTSRSSWLAGQNFYTIDIDVNHNMALIEIRRFGDYCGARKQFLIGTDNGHPWIAHLPPRFEFVIEAIEYLKPAAVKKAEARGLNILRQGDWFFIPATRPYRTAKNHGFEIGLDGDHIPTELVATGYEQSSETSSKLVPIKSIYVRGRLDHGQHNSLFFGDQWHKAIRNTAIRTGRLALGGYAD